MLFSVLCCCLSRCKFFYRFRKWGRKVSCYFLRCVFHSPSSGKPIVHHIQPGLHFAPPLLYAKPVTCNRYQTSTCFYSFTSSFTTSFRYTHRHTHTAFRRIVNTLLLLSNGLFKRFIPTRGRDMAGSPAPSLCYKTDTRRIWGVGGGRVPPPKGGGS